MIVPELKDFDVYSPSGLNFVYLMVTLWDEGETEMNSEIVAEYEIKIYDAYAYYKITKREYNEKLTIKQTRECDECLERLYESNTFENAYVEAYNEPDDELTWFI
jgi:formylmethanofuran dehydrogenase subunit E